MSVVANVAINIDGKQAQSLLNAIQGEVEKLNGSFDQVKKKGANFGASIQKAAGSVVGQLAAVAGAAFTVQQAFTTLSNQSKAEAALRTLGVDAGAATQQFAQLSKELNGQASTVELTTAAYDVASAGFTKAADQTKILEAATKGAVGGMSDINTVGNAVTSVLNAYGMSADQAANLVDGFIQTQNDGKIVLGEYAALIGRLAPTAAAAGVGIKELNAAVATITAQGVAPETAITGLNQALVSILKPTSEASELSRKLGIDFNEAGLRSKGLAGFLDEVAKATGGSASQLTTLFGSVDALKAVLPLLSGDMQKFVQNLIKQDQAAGVATKAFNEMSATLEGALKEVDTAFKNLVVGFKPLVPAIIAPFKVLASTINLVAGNIKELAVTATFIGTFVGTMKAAVLVTKAWALATQGLAAAKKAAGVAAAFLKAVMNPASLVQIGIALGVATGAAIALGKAMEGAGNKAQKAKVKQGEIADETTKLNAKIDQLVNSANKVPPAFQSSKEAAAELKLEVQGIRNTFVALNAEQEQLIASIDGSLKIAEARHQAESAIRDVIKDQLKDQLDQAATQQDRIKIAKKIYDIEIANAKSALKLTLQRIKAEVDRVNIAIKTQELKLQELDVEMRILRSREQNTSEIEGAIASQRNALNIAISTARTVEEIARYQSQSAIATFNSQKNAAALAFQQNIVARNTNAAATAAGQFATQMERGAAAANAVYRRPGVTRTLEDMAASIGTLGRVSTQTLIYTDEEMRKLGIGPYANAGTRAQHQAQQSAARAAAAVTPFATGGVVTKPTLGLVGEAGTEYIVPEAKAASFAANYLSGARGEAALNTTSSIPTINIQTGPVMQQDGQRYVTISDLEGAMQQVADTLLNSGRTAGGRRFAGVR